MKYKLHSRQTTLDAGFFNAIFWSTKPVASPESSTLSDRFSNSRRTVAVWAVFSITLISVSGCSESADSLAMPPEERYYDPAQLARGEQTYNDNCAQCHGADASGDPNWRQPDGNGQFRPPPLNGTGHTWHHPLTQLRHAIENGGPPGESNMPAWGDTLTDEDIDDLIAWFQSLWPNDIYETWYQIEQRSQHSRRRS